MRAAALRILVRVDRGGAFADILLDRAQRRFSDPRDRALLTELVMGTLRWRGTLDAALAPFLKRPIETADAVSRGALRLGAYQLLFLRTPARAVLHETVEAAKGIRGARIGGLVNAVLREWLRADPPPSRPTGANPSPDDVARSVPPALRAALSQSLGREEADAFLAASLATPPFTVRVNRLRRSREELLERLGGAGMEPAPCVHSPDGIVLGRPAGVQADPGLAAGEFLVTDEGAQLIAPLLAPAPGEVLLDACASPGGKATHLAELSGGGARVVAVDLPGRLRLLRDTVSRLAPPGVTVRAHDFSRGPLPDSAGGFDKALVDAPCTGTGVIRRNPDAKWRFSPADPGRMARLQEAILSNVWPSVRPGGLLVYCTCTLLREENEGVIGSFLRNRPDAVRVTEPPPGWPGPEAARTREGFLRLLPHRHGTDGFFAAILAKRGKQPRGTIDRTAA
ncbi:MAG: 16S rRNA (cytosine(967)-C(5))-methyltransferase RsmB [Deltaproteobacteria bacterium]